jgi:cytoskeletal protein CcmA (bactofilin family)
MTDNYQKGAVIIGEGVVIKGVVSTSGDAVILGEVEGEVNARELTVGDTGKLKGKIVADIANIHGIVHENVKVNNSLNLGKTGRIYGSVEYCEIEIEKGGEIVGTLTQSGTAVGREAPKDADAQPGNGAGNVQRPLNQ